MQESYLIIPSVPTPNGALHLGHVGGPYLSADICARHLRMLGHKVVIASGVDSYDSYVIEAAKREKLSNEEVNTHFHNRIVDDLFDMHIDIAAFINPILPEWQQRYAQYHQTMLESLFQNNKVNELSEYLPYDFASQQFLTGFSLDGLCPYCFKNIAGYFCENCGAHFKPEEVLHRSSVHEKQMLNLFMTVPKEINLARQGVNEHLHQLYKKVFAAQNYNVRLTTYASWGLPGKHPGQVLFNYSFVYAYFLMLGEIAQGFLQEDSHPFNFNSNVKTICAMGIDNSMPFIASILGMTDGSNNYKGMDYYLINHFYHLNGLKFSSSKQHAIWVADLPKNNWNADIIRLFLASVDVRNGTGNITKQKIIQFHDEISEWLQQIELSFTQLSLTTIDEGFIQQLKYLLSMLNNVLKPDNFLPHVAVKLIRQSMSQPINFWWLKAWSIILYPFMPVIAQQIWNALGYTGEPNYQDFAAEPLAPFANHLSFNLPLQPAQMETCA